MVKDSEAHKVNTNGEGKRPVEQQKKKGKSNARGGRN